MDLGGIVITNSDWNTPYFPLQTGGAVMRPTPSTEV